MLDVLVTCHPHRKDIELFPQVRGFYLAKHLARLGLRAEFHHLPVPRRCRRCTVLICSEYQQTMGWFDRNLAGPLSKIEADRMYCMADVSLLDNDEDAFSREYCEWFGARGGVLCHLAPHGCEPFEVCIGLGVDADIFRADAGRTRRDRVVFDFPRTASRDVASEFDVTKLDQVRAAVPDLRIAGTGPADAPIVDAFDEWVPYGQPHAQYVNAAFGRAAVVVVGWRESLGLAVAEAQVAGAAIVARPNDLPDQLADPARFVSYDGDDPAWLAAAVAEAARRDHDAISAAAVAQFDYDAVAARTKVAVGL